MNVCKNGLFMELGELVTTLMHGHTYKQVADATGLSKGTISQIVQGQTESPDPRTLERLASYFGQTEGEQRRIYAELMFLAGYFNRLPVEVLGAFQTIPEIAASEELSRALEAALEEARQFVRQDRAKQKEKAQRPTTD